jgi:hypothetical protein
MILLNFSHPITPEQLAQIEQLSECIEGVITLTLPVQFDNDQPFLPQVRALVAQIPLSPFQWQSEPVLINLPGLSIIAGLLLLEIMSKISSGNYPIRPPELLRFSRDGNSLPPIFKVAEIITPPFF